MTETLKTENKMEKEIKEEIREEVKQKLLPTSTEDTEEDKDVKSEIFYTKGIFLRKSFVPSLISRQVRISLSKKKQQNVL